MYYRKIGTIISIPIKSNSRNPKAKKAWVQEEPLNMGAAGYIKARWNYDPLTFVTRPASASPAVGFKKVHDKQLIELMDQAFGF